MINESSVFDFNIEIQKCGMIILYIFFFGPTAPKETEGPLNPGRSLSLSLSVSLSLSLSLRPLIFLDNRTLEFSNFLYVD